MKNDFPSTYTSPLTGNVYDVVPVQRSRVAYGEFMNPATKYIHEYTEYQIVLNGSKVQFCFDLKDIPAQVANYEGVSDGWYSSPRD